MAVTYRTQKAQGIMALSRTAMPGVRPITGHVVTSRDQLVESPEFDEERELIQTSALRWATSDAGLFARGCPEFPAHGFRDSVCMHADTLPDLLAALRDLWDECRALDPNAELVLMPYANPALNAIYRGDDSGAVVTFGLGHDGATSGKDSLSVPAPALHPDGRAQYASLFDTSRITETPYIEAVIGEHEPADDARRADLWMRLASADIRTTQLRNGPGGDRRPDYIPAPMTITSVIQTNGEDLVAWKTRVETLPPQTAVYHPGGNCSDHYFVHCRVHAVPIFTTRRPLVGEVLVPPPRQPLDTRAFHRGAAVGMILPLRHDRSSGFSTRAAVAALAHTLHSGAQLEGRESYWLGLGAMLMVRLGMAAALGEYRHSFRSQDLHGHSRDAIYTAILDDYQTHRPLVDQAWASFQFGKWSGGYGGRPWADCTAAVMELEARLLAACAAPTSNEALILRVLDQFNTTVNLAHNNGWWLNKFTSKELFDEMALGLPGRVLASATYLYAAHRYAETQTDALHTAIRTLRTLRATTPLTLAYAEPPAPFPARQPWSLAFMDALAVAEDAFEVCARVTSPDCIHLQITHPTLTQYLRLDLTPEPTAGPPSGNPYYFHHALPVETFATFKALLEATPYDRTSMSGSGTPYTILLAQALRVQVLPSLFRLKLQLTLPGESCQLILRLERLLDITYGIAAQQHETPDCTLTPECRAEVLARYGLDVSHGPVPMQQSESSEEDDDECDCDDCLAKKEN